MGISDNKVPYQCHSLCFTLIETLLPMIWCDVSGKYTKERGQRTPDFHDLYFEFREKCILSDKAWVDLESSEYFFCVFLCFGYKITENREFLPIIWCTPVLSVIQILTRIQLPTPTFYEWAISYFSCLELHEFTPFKTKIFIWGAPPDPHYKHIYIMKTSISSVCLWSEGLANAQMTISLPKISMNVNYYFVWKVDLNNTSVEGKEPLQPSVFPPPLF